MTSLIPYFLLKTPNTDMGVRLLLLGRPYSSSSSSSRGAQAHHGRPPHHHIWQFQNTHYVKSNFMKYVGIRFCIQIADLLTVGGWHPPPPSPLVRRTMMVHTTNTTSTKIYMYEEFCIGRIGLIDKIGLFLLSRSRCTLGATLLLLQWGGRRWYTTTTSTGGQSAKGRRGGHMCPHKKAEVQIVWKQSMSWVSYWPTVSLDKQF